MIQDNVYVRPSAIQIEMFPLPAEKQNEIRIQALEKKCATLNRAYGALKTSTNYRISLLEAELSFVIGKLCKQENIENSRKEMQEKRIQLTEMIA